jgi:Kef-type K+ transport system membrane component KefB
MVAAWVHLFVFALLSPLLLLTGKAAQLIRLPLITGYVLAGIIIGPYCLRLLDGEGLQSLAPVSHVPSSAESYLTNTHYNCIYSWINNKDIICALDSQVDSGCLAVIAFSAGAELQIGDVRRMKNQVGLALRVVPSTTFTLKRGGIIFCWH